MHIVSNAERTAPSEYSPRNLLSLYAAFNYGLEFNIARGFATGNVLPSVAVSQPRIRLIDRCSTGFGGLIGAARIARLNRSRQSDNANARVRACIYALTCTRHEGANTEEEVEERLLLAVIDFLNTPWY